MKKITSFNSSGGVGLQNTTLELIDVNTRTFTVLLLPVCEDMLYTKMTQEA